MGQISVRCIVSDVDTAVAFYAEMLGFQVEIHPGRGFAGLSRGALRLLLNQPGAGGAGETMPDGQVPAPGGWNRIQIEVDDLTATVDRLNRAGCRLRPPCDAEKHRLASSECRRACINAGVNVRLNTVRKAA